MTIPWLALLVPLLEHWYIKTEALSFLYDDMDIISINNWTGNTVSLLTFCGGVNKQGKKAIIAVLEPDEYKKYLDSKLGEELGEYLTSDNVEELADLAEVIYAILDIKGVTWEEFERIRLSKVNERGAFKKRLLLKEVYETES